MILRNDCREPRCLPSTLDLPLDKVPHLVMSPTPYNLPALVKKINATSNDLGKDTREARRQCSDAARSLSSALLWKRPSSRSSGMSVLRFDCFYLTKSSSADYGVGISKGTILRFVLVLTKMVSKNWTREMEMQRAALNLRR